MFKQILLFAVLFPSIICFSQSNAPNVLISSNFKNAKSQYQVDYRIVNGLECVTYDVKLILYDNQNKSISTFKLSGDLNSVRGNIMQSIYWDVYKDRESFPEIGKAEVSIVKINKPLVKVLIESVPSGAYVYFGSEKSGFTPLNVEVQEGDYQLRIQKSDYEDLTEYVNVALCQKILFYPLKKLHYNLSLYSKPSDANIFIDGNFVSKTPTSLTRSVGKHHVVIVKDGFMKRKRSITLDTNLREKAYFLKPKTIFGIGCIGGNKTLGGEFLFFFSRVELDLSMMKTEPFIELPYANYSSLGYSIMLGYRIPYPIDFSIHAGLGLRAFTNKDDKNNSNRYYTFVTGITLPIYFSPKFGIYIKGDYWLKTEKSDMFLFSGGLMLKL